MDSWSLRRTKTCTFPGHAWGGYPVWRMMTRNKEPGCMTTFNVIYRQLSIISEREGILKWTLRHHCDLINTEMIIYVIRNIIFYTHMYALLLFEYIIQIKQNIKWLNFIICFMLCMCMHFQCSLISPLFLLWCNRTFSGRSVEHSENNLECIKEEPAWWTNRAAPTQNWNSVYTSLLFFLF